VKFVLLFALGTSVTFLIGELVMKRIPLTRRVFYDVKGKGVSSIAAADAAPPAITGAAAFRSR
jgi:hypothetical protein